MILSVHSLRSGSSAIGPDIRILLSYFNYSMYFASSRSRVESIRASSGWTILLIVLLSNSVLWNGVAHSFYPAVPAIAGTETGQRIRRAFSRFKSWNETARHVKHPDWNWLPNGLTILRLVAGVMLPWLPADWLFTVLLAAGFTDLIDGWIGRLLGAASHFGQIADPIADKTLVMAAIFCALRADWLSWAELFALAARDLTVLILSCLALAHHLGNWRKLTPRLSGKIATGAQILALLTLFWTRHPQPILVGIAGGFSIFSALDYGWRAFTEDSTRP